MPDLESLNLKIKADSTSATSKLDALTKSMKKLKDASGSMSTGGKIAINALSGIKTAATLSGKALKGVGSAISKAMPSFKGLNMSLGDIKLKFVAVVAVMRKVVQGLASCVKQSMDFVETMNLFNVSMGDNAIAAGEFAEKVQQAMGIDMAEWMRNQGVFQTLIEGFGVASEKADIMSQQMTQLGYDLSSLFNMPFAESMQKLQSGIAGELEPLRRLGFDLSQAKLQQIAYDHGIQQSISTMTQAQKVQLRYYAIMTQVTTAHGDMARTIMQPANMLRVMHQNVVIAARSIGNLFIPIIQKLAAVAIIVARGIAKVANAIAALFGIDSNGWRNFVDDLNYTGDTFDDTMDDISSGIDGTGSSAKKASKRIKEFKKQFLGFDKINNITLPDPYNYSGSGGRGSGGGGVGGGGDFDLPLPTYDFLQGIDDAFAKVHPKLQKLFDDLAKDMENGGKHIGTILGKAIRDALNSIRWDKIQVKGNMIVARIADGINKFLEVPGLFTSVGKTLGNALNTVFGMANTWAKVFHWDSLGKAIADTINGFFKTFKLKLVADTFSSWATGIINMYASAIGNTDFKQIAKNIGEGLESIRWRDIKKAAKRLAKNVAKGLNDLFSNESVFKGIGSTLANTINTVLTMAKTWAVKFDWKNLGKQIGKTINSFFSTFDFTLAANTIEQWAKGLLTSATKAVSTIDWRQVGEKIAQFLGDIDWEGLMEQAVELAKVAITGAIEFTISFVKNIFSEILQWLYDVIVGRSKAILDINLGGSEDPSFKKVKAEYDDTKPKTVTLTSKGERYPSFETTKEQYDGVTDKKATVTTKGVRYPSFETTRKQYNGVNDKKTTLTTKGERYPSFKTTRKQYNEIDDKKAKLTAKAEKWPSFNTVRKQYNEIDDKKAELTATGSRADSFNTVKSVYEGIKSKSVSISASATLSKGVKDLKSLIDAKSPKKFNFTATGSSMTLTPQTMAQGGIFKNGRWRPIATAANGGAFNTGQMFIAREAGPEMVGRIGRSTAVMNNNQIVSSVAAGVASANSTQNALLRQLVSAVQNGGQPVILQVDSTKLGQVAIRSINQVQRQAGRTLLDV